MIRKIFLFFLLILVLLFIAWIYTLGNDFFSLLKETNSVKMALSSFFQNHPRLLDDLVKVFFALVTLLAVSYQLNVNKELFQMTILQHHLNRKVEGQKIIEAHNQRFLNWMMYNRKRYMEILDAGYTHEMALSDLVESLYNHLYSGIDDKFQVRSVQRNLEALQTFYLQINESDLINKQAIIIEDELAALERKTPLFLSTLLSNFEKSSDIKIESKFLFYYKVTIDVLKFNGNGGIHDIVDFSKI